MKKILKRLLLIVIFLFISVSLFATEVKQDTILTTTVQFVVNTNKVVKNDPGYTYFQNKMIPFLEEHIESLEKVEFVGSASPEGPDELNKKLSRMRAEVLANQLSIPENKKDIQYVGENYNLLLSLITDQSQKDTLTSIINSGFNVKKRINKLPFYKEHLNSLYPLTRCVEVKMYFKKGIITPCLCDTIYINNPVYLIDTVYIHSTDTLYLEKPFKKIPVVAVKTNLTPDLLIAPNIQMELYTYLWGLSLDFSYTFPWYYNDSIYWYYQILNGTVGIRKYFNNEYYGHYVSIYGNSMIYDICFNKKNGYQGEGYGFGVSYGYVFRNKKHPKFKVEPFIRVGYLYTKFDTYHASEPWDGKYYYNWYKKASDFVPRRLEMNYFGPTMVGFNLTYDLICLRRY